MPNVHTPERGPDESQRDYRARQAASRLLAKIATLRIGTQMKWKPMMNSRGIEEPPPLRQYWDGQHTNPGRNTSRKALKAAGGHRQYKRDMKFVRRSLTSASARGATAWQ